MPATYEPIATTTLGSATNRITFNSISSTYTDLRLTILGTFAGAGNNYFLTVNNDTTALYSQIVLSADGSVEYAQNRTGVSNWVISDGSYVGGSTTYATFSTVDFFTYSGSQDKTILSSSSASYDSTGFVHRTYGMYRSSTAISRVDVVASGGTNMNAGTIATLYGILKA